MVFEKTDYSFEYSLNILFAALNEVYCKAVIFESYNVQSEDYTNYLNWVPSYCYEGQQTLYYGFPQFEVLNTMEEFKISDIVKNFEITEVFFSDGFIDAVKDSTNLFSYVSGKNLKYYSEANIYINYAHSYISLQWKSKELFDVSRIIDSIDPILSYRIE